ncbi:MAG: type II secretion system protein M [Marinobacter sp.]|uniref:type II secretion system protein M n=1 Tax=Marinobacter sp. TaxID=50741 RepID=UPI00299E6C9E|nr:type II secretion system protein M [Marinobacter sp.]MDX1755550.1 type II secretion system protein M [Marinobacter sp.]
MLQKIKDHPAVGKMIAQYDHLPKRDQQALLVLLIAVALAVVYFGIWRPAAGFHERAVSARENSAELLAWMQENRAAIQQLSASDGDRGGASQLSGSRALMSTVTRTAGQSGLSLNRFEPSGDSAIRVWLEDVPFKNVASWLEGLHQEYGVVVDQASFDRGDAPGVVSVRLTLEI